jgi:hypothetical protein
VSGLAVIRHTAASLVPKGRRGRLSHDDCAKAVAAVLRADLLQLKECAIRALLDRAVGEVELLTLNQRDPASRRIAWFLHLWYKEYHTVTVAAEVLELSRSYIAHTIQPRALELVAKHFLDLTWRIEVSACMQLAEWSSELRV